MYIVRKLVKALMLHGSLYILLIVVARAGVIDFELTASGNVPVDNQEILFTDKFISDGVGISFGFDSDLDGTLDEKAVFEEVGNKDKHKDTGFKFSGIPDMTAAGYEEQLGSFFIRQSTPYKPFGVFTILYDSGLPVSAASGEIWDIDGNENKGTTEQFLVKAFNLDTLLESIESPIGNDKTLNGMPWAFGFDGLSNITKLEITFTGSKTKGIGLAFNNFSPVQDVSKSNLQFKQNLIQIPEPSGYLIFFTVFAWLVVTRLSFYRI